MSAGWSRFDRGVTIGAGGSETGTILVDEEHPLGGRITIERCVTEELPSLSRAASTAGWSTRVTSGRRTRHGTRARR